MSYPGSNKKRKPVMMIHGGAWAMPDKMVEDTKKGIKDAALAGYRTLRDGRSAVDAVEAAIVSLENNPNFDAGNGSVLTADGKVEMDAMIMDGSTLNAGSVGCVNNIANPIKLARMVMEKTDHVLFVGEGANRFAHEMGVPQVSTDSLIGEYAKEEWERFSSGEYASCVSTMFKRRDVKQSGHDTVGAVAVDADGNVACGTSTGGITFKKPGRVGDTPLVGCGGYADNKTGAVSTTGHGEGMIKVCLAKHVTVLMDQGSTAQEASVKAVESLNDRVQSSGGVIVVSKDGDIGQYFTTDRMARAWVKDDRVFYGVETDDIISCPV
ncbi:isoaspartyl peptidase/L-asparaginase [Patella vulgata]|uniref:isoaspartyl peptidase/L-asparaginase n=1 Tax=Patella vulgata TaxID=6465 RepID=UPI0024A9004C|nr:isoaspartyl peptidase/L-asparaginase [Patella vulgata]